MAQAKCPDVNLAIKTRKVPGRSKKARQRTVILLKPEDGPERTVFVYKSDEVLEKLDEYDGKIIDSDFDLPELGRLLKDVHELGLVLVQKKKSYDVLRLREDGTPFQVTAIRDLEVLKTYLERKKAFNKRLAEDGDGGRVYMDEILKYIASGDSPRTSDPESVAIARFSLGKEGFVEPTDKFGNAVDCNASDEALDIAVEKSLIYWYPPEKRVEFGKMTPEELANFKSGLRERIKEEMKGYLYGKDSKHGCVEIIPSNDQALDERRTVLKFFEDEDNLISQNFSDTRKKWIAFQERLRGEKGIFKSFPNEYMQLSGTDTPEGMEELVAKIDLIQLDSKQGNPNFTKLKELVLERRDLLRDLDKVVKDIKNTDPGYTFHHTCKPIPSSKKLHGLDGEVAVEMQIISVESHLFLPSIPKEKKSRDMVTPRLIDPYEEFDYDDPDFLEALRKANPGEPFPDDPKDLWEYLGAPKDYSLNSDLRGHFGFYGFQKRIFGLNRRGRKFNWRI